MLALSEVEKVRLFRKISDRYCDYNLKGIIVLDLNGVESNDPLSEFSACSQEALVKRIELTYGDSPTLQSCVKATAKDGGWIVDHVYQWLRDLRFRLNNDLEEYWIEPVEIHLRDFRIPLEFAERDGIRYLRGRSLRMSGEDNEDTIITRFGERPMEDRNGRMCPLCLDGLYHSEGIHWRIEEFYTE